MSDEITHECGISMIRLRKDLSYYHRKYKNAIWAFNKLLLLMEKQRNRGQDGVGIGCCKLNMPHGQPYLFRERSTDPEALREVFDQQLDKLSLLEAKKLVDPDDPKTIKANFDYGGEILFGHLRYGTSGVLFDEGVCHPYVRRSNWVTRSLMVMGNFNMTNTHELSDLLIDRGQHPVFGTDTQTVLEEIGYHLDEEHTEIYRELHRSGMDGRDIPKHISESLDITKIIIDSTKRWDGGYTIAGVIGNGDCFAFRDPLGIRPCHILINDEVVAIASERVPLMTVFNESVENIREVEPGSIIAVRANGEIQESRFAEPCPPAKCSFERIYFSRGNDPQIYKERKKLGAALAPQILDAVDHDLQNTVLSFIPNTAEMAYYGLFDRLRYDQRRIIKDDLIRGYREGTLTEELIEEMVMRHWLRGEKVAHKDAKLRTFISQEENRKKLATHVYDITYDIVQKEDSLVVVDDSIVRGNTLKNSILKILKRTNPKRIIIASTAPQVRYPDCYGIDMAQMGEFIAFEAAVDLLKMGGKDHLLAEVYQACKEELLKSADERRNPVQQIYKSFTPDQISAQITQRVLANPASQEEGIKDTWKGEIKVIYQTIENLHAAVSQHRGDWYFTGNYPTPGGYTIVNQAYINFFENRKGRASDLL